MSLIHRLWGRRRAIVLAVLGLSAPFACSAAGGSPRAGVAALRIDVPVHEPIWSDHAQALFALTDNGRIAKIDLSEQSGGLPTARTMLSAPFPDAGENLVTGTTEAVVYLPQPKRGQVAAISDGDLHQIGAGQAGPSPSFLALDSGSGHLLALSANRSAVTPIDLHNKTVLPPQYVHAGPDAELHGAKRGRRIDYHVSGPRGITHYRGNPRSVQNEGTIGIAAERTVGDPTKSSRIYVAEKGTDRLLALDSKRTQDGLEVVAQAGLGEPVHYIGVDETRIYAATEHTLVVLETNSFEGYHEQTFPILSSTDFRSALQGDVKNAPLSGLAVGPDRVYLTFKGQPYVVSVAKPSI
jgi:hypothetical protein